MGFIANAQSLSFPIKVTYELNAYSDSSDLSKSKLEYMELFMNDNSALFRSYNLGESLENLSKGINRSKSSIMGMEIYWNQSTITYYDSYNYPLSYVESMENLKWNLEDETKLILGYNCQKATVEYGGRKWEAWFTFDVPYPYGPYKFGNLPGLILEIYDVKNEWSFLALEIDTQKDRKVLVSRNFNKPSSIKLGTSQELLHYIWEQHSTAVDRFIAAGAKYSSPEKEKSARETIKSLLNQTSNWIEIFR